MLAAIEKLLVLQDRDRQIAQLRRERDRLPDERVEADAILAQGNAELNAAKEALKVNEIERKKLELEAGGKWGTANKYKGQLCQIKSNIEYQALQKEISQLEEEIRQIEDRELEWMERGEILQKQIRERSTQVKLLAERVAAQKADFDVREKIIHERLARLESERAALTKDLEEAIFERYERILASKGDLAVAAIEHENCGGCHLHLPPQLIHAVRNAGELETCSNCGRILYWSE